ncbi:RNase adapter RapZ [Weissella paramesenteroides]|uniref:RNase adapter RapZ n=1 Tax=Weissella paramesenteroides TaxID=1249 RepID=A0ABD4XHZ9_WEIPA|nr:RNase adapter RapZ [Weissella paramesenteroides]MDF8368648.1 RNase adapter RapZ [Weissella paramesenteroides]MDF8370580.1 RNase adapter RapZ [Weissella paramesenteroides]
MDKKELVIVTGMSGAGKTVAIQAFEDLGYFTVQNLPPAMLPKFWQMISDEENIQRAAVMIDLRSQSFFADLDHEVRELRKNSHDKYDLKIVYIDASDGELVARYKETRRSHPLSGEGGTLYGIQLEREKLAKICDLASEIIHTDDYAPRQLRNYIQEHFGSETDQAGTFSIQVMSFGFKYGIAVDADLVFDVRFLPNPYYQEDLRQLTGLDKAVADYVWRTDDAKEFYERISEQIKWLLPKYKAEGKSTLTVAFGCTGGQHRSVAFAHRLHEDLAKNWVVNERHRDIERRKESSNRS